MNRYEKLLLEGKNPADTYRKIRHKTARILKNEGQIPIPYESEVKIELVKQHLSIGVLEARSKMVRDFIFGKSGNLT